MTVTRTEFLEHAEQALSPADFSREQLLKLFTGAPRAFWRHDVDISLAAAVRMARFAEVAGVRSTFYLNPRCDFYNLFSREGRDTVRHILDCGHQLGVHVEDALGDPEQDAANDLQLAEAWYGPVTFGRRVSFHMPKPAVLWRVFRPFFENAYAPEWEGRYVSDSRGVPIAEQVTDDMQVSLHPEHWAL